LMPTRLAHEEKLNLRQLRHVCHALDTDRDGCLSRVDLHRALVDLGVDFGVEWMSEFREDALISYDDLVAEADSIRASAGTPTTHLMVSTSPQSPSAQSTVAGTPSASSSQHNNFRPISPLKGSAGAAAVLNPSVPATAAAPRGPRGSDALPWSHKYQAAARVQLQNSHNGFSSSDPSSSARQATTPSPSSFSSVSGSRLSPTSTSPVGASKTPQPSVRHAAPNTMW
jgi:hypothetical protein